MSNHLFNLYIAVLRDKVKVEKYYISRPGIEFIKEVDTTSFFILRSQ